ncbi:MAG: alpha-glucan family phosphorylase [Nitrospinota bacterium]
MMRKIIQYMVRPSLPERLEPLYGISKNLWWSWHPDAIALWRRLDPQLWFETGHNPTKLLGSISQSRLDELAEDDSFTNHMNRVIYALNEYMESDFWFKKAHKSALESTQIAYFSAEYGITDCLPIYSGGLGILSGDHLKSASDLGLPLVGVGLLYQQGYFQQYLNPDGWQQEFYPENDFFTMPVFRELDEAGNEIKISVPYPNRMVTARIWRAQVGRIPLYLLDTNIPENHMVDRTITHQLYGGDNITRVEQEILLGMGGVKALKALNIHPNVFHMNEGHSAFLALERILGLTKEAGLSYNEAKEEVIASSVFTTHTPVPAGNDRFDRDMILEYFNDYIHEVNISAENFLALGCQDPSDNDELFCMTVLAMKLSSFTNGVSKLHSEVSKNMWNRLYAGLDRKDVPIKAITNGVHIRSWLSNDMWGLFDRYLGPQWEHEPANDAVWRKIQDIPDAELWRTHERRRERLVAFVRNRMRTQMEKRGASSSDLLLAEEALRPDALTIGFARRFATYKRATLLFSDLERLTKILNNKERPVQIIIAGKAHPKDSEGKNLIKSIIHWIRDSSLKDKVVFVENYDISVARCIVQGVDVWLNTPRRPLEASGTSGMKASANGALNLSILDGWWCEGYEPDTGWAIGSGEDYDDHKEQDLVESTIIYDLLEKDIIPLFYDRSADDTPRGWVNMMKQSLSKLNLVFNTNRMVRNYTNYFYLSCANKYQKLTSNDKERLKSLASWKENIYSKWANVVVGTVFTEGSAVLSVGDMVKAEVEVDLAGLSHDDLLVEIYYGNLSPNNIIEDGNPAPMKFENMQNNKARFVGYIPLVESGRHGFTVRVTPSHPDLFGRVEPGLIHWST